MKFTAIALATLLTTCTAVAPATAGGNNGPDFGGNTLAAEIYAGGGYSKSEAINVSKLYSEQRQSLSNTNNIGVGVNSTNINNPTAYGGAGGRGGDGGNAVSLSRGGDGGDSFATGGKSNATGGNANALQLQNAQGGKAQQDQGQNQDQQQDQNQTANGGRSDQNQSQTNGSLVSNVGGQQTEVGGQNTNVDVSFAGDEAAASSAIAPTIIHGNNNECYWTFTFGAAAQGMSGGGSAGAGLFPIRLETCMKFMLADRYASGAANHPEAARLLREIEASLN